MKNKKRLLLIVSFLSIILLSFKPTEFIRTKYSLNNNEWKFIRQDVKNAYKVSFDDSKWLSVCIPHDYNGGIDLVHDDVFNGRYNPSLPESKSEMYKGPGWYRTTFIIDKKYLGKRIFIEFEAVSLEAQVWVNGKKIGQHKGGYTSFSFEITDFIKYDKINTLAVRSDNRNNDAIAPWIFDETKAFPFGFDYAVYGGIYRDVWITITDPVRIEQVLNTPTCGGQGPAMISIGTKVKNYTSKERFIKLTSTIIDPKGKKIATLSTKKTIAKNSELFIEQSESALGDIQFWSPDKPNIYTVKSILSYDNKEADANESVFGFRYYTLTNNQAFSINGKEMLIRGVNRHQDMEGVGYALANDQHRLDAKIIKDAGFNFVRHAHYPCDREFTKACDELGLMLWLEIPLSMSISENPEFLQNCKTQLAEMIEQNYNNPSVIIWGLGNESDKQGKNEALTNKVFSELDNLAKELDATRPTTGCNFHFASNQKLVDVYSPQDWNGWYGGAIHNYNPKEIIGEYGADIEITNHGEFNLDITKNHTPANNPRSWSQEYGALLHEYKISKAEENKDNFPGHFAWVAFDFASPRADRKMNPIPFMNQKGLMMHDHKTPKDVYYLYQSMYRTANEFPMVYIVSETWTDRWENEGAKDIWVYSNCDSVFLYNDLEKTISYGSRIKDSGPRNDTRYQWDSVLVKYNLLYAEAWYKNIMVATDTIILEHLQKK